jgi:PAS domain S-box-containing protein
MAKDKFTNRDKASPFSISNRQFEAMLEIASSVLKCVEIDDILSAVTKELSRVLDFDRSSVAFIAPGGEKLLLRNIYKRSGGGNPGEGVEIDVKPTSVIGWVALTREPVLRVDIDSDDRFEEIVGEEPLKSDMVVPLTARGELAGTLNVGSYKRNAFTYADLEVLKNCSRFVCVAIEHVMLLNEARELAARYKLLQENANDIIFLIDKKSGKIVEANRKCELIFGYPQDDLLGKSYFDLFAEEDLHQARKDFIRMLSDKSSSFIDRRMVSRDNRIIFVDINANLLDIHDKTYIQVIIHDISQRKMLEQQIIFQNKRLQEINSRLMEVDKMKTEFLANISHELRTPLSIIIAYSESLRSEKLSKSERSKFLGVIEENSEKLLGLINNLIDLSKLEVSGYQLHLTLSHVHDVVRSVFTTVKKEAARKSIELRFDPGPDIPVIYFDNNRISQVLLSLLSNAIKFSDDGGKVVVSTEQQGGEILVKVKDNGAGIKPEKLPYIFTTFQQADGSSSRRWGGMGIGLALAKHIVRLHGGDLWVESEYGKGSEFTFSLPVETEEALLEEGPAGDASKG